MNNPRTKPYETLECLANWAKVDPENPDMWYGVGMVFIDLALYNRAARAFQRVLVIDPDDAFAWNGLGITHSSTGRHADAYRAYREALRIDPDIPEASMYLNLARTLSSIPVQPLEDDPGLASIDPATAAIISDLDAILDISSSDHPSASILHFPSTSNR